MSESAIFADIDSLYNHEPGPIYFSPPAVEMLIAAADRLDEYAGILSPTGDYGTIALAHDIRTFAERYSRG